MDYLNLQVTWLILSLFKGIRSLSCAHSEQNILTCHFWPVYKKENIFGGANKSEWWVLKICISSNVNNSAFNGKLCNFFSNSDVSPKMLGPWVTRQHFYQISYPFISTPSFSLLGPSQAPGSFRVRVLTSTSVNTSWQLPPAESVHGVLLGFKLLYRIKNSPGPLTSVTIASNLTLTRPITGLGKYTEYEFQVLAFSSVGNGPLSNVSVARTKEDGKISNLPNRLVTALILIP